MIIKIKVDIESVVIYTFDIQQKVRSGIFASKRGNLK